MGNANDVEMRRRLRRVGVPGALAVMLVCCQASGASAAQEIDTKPDVATSASGGAAHTNLLMISIDTLRADHLSCYGYSRVTSPTIDALAGEGRFFTQAIAASAHTAPSHMSVFTSQYPFEHGVHSLFAPGGLADSTKTLAEVLHAQGYQTAAVVGFSGPRYRFGPSFGLARGFQLWEYPNRFSELNGKIQAWLETHRDEPFFLFVHAYDVHDPHLVFDDFDARRFDPGYDGPVPGTWGELIESSDVPFDWPSMLQIFRSGIADELQALHVQVLQQYHRFSNRDAIPHIEAVYDAQIYYADQGIGRLMGWLRELELDEETLIVIMADHGQEFGEHGEIASHNQLYDEVLRIPLIFSGPGIPSGDPLDQMVSAIDIMPTVLDLLGLPVPDSTRGSSLAALLRGDPREEPHEEVFSELHGNVALRTRSWKLIVRGDGSRELYDLRSDPGEQQNVSAQEPTKLAELHDRLRSALSTAGAGEFVGQASLEPWQRGDTYW